MVSSGRAVDDGVEEAKEEPKKRRWRRVRESIFRPKREASFSTLSDVVLMLPYLERRAPLLRYSVRQREFLALVVAYTVVPWFFLVMSRRIVGTAFLWCVTLIYGVGGLASMGGSGYIMYRVHTSPDELRYQPLMHIMQCTSLCDFGFALKFFASSFLTFFGLATISWSTIYGLHLVLTMVRPLTVGRKNRLTLARRYLTTYHAFVWTSALSSCVAAHAAGAMGPTADGTCWLTGHWVFAFYGPLYLYVLLAQASARARESFDAARSRRFGRRSDAPSSLVERSRASKPSPMDRRCDAGVRRRRRPVAQRVAPPVADAPRRRRRVAAEFKKHHELCFRALLVTETFVLVWVYGIIFRLDGYVHSGGTEPWLILTQAVWLALSGFINFMIWRPFLARTRERTEPAPQRGFPRPPSR
ncbi:hypothetical protein JL720_11136 [Aureococcus anophagefferens]|nr:hypothetical protein JL720_11136 [Aureococcus anophagefferens]